MRRYKVYLYLIGLLFGLILLNYFYGFYIHTSVNLSASFRHTMAITTDEVTHSRVDVSTQVSRTITTVSYGAGHLQVHRILNNDTATLGNDKTVRNRSPSVEVITDSPSKIFDRENSTKIYSSINETKNVSFEIRYDQYHGSGFERKIDGDVRSSKSREPSIEHATSRSLSTNYRKQDLKRPVIHRRFHSIRLDDAISATKMRRNGMSSSELQGHNALSHRLNSLVNKKHHPVTYPRNIEDAPKNIVNPHNFSYIHNPDQKCRNLDIEVVICTPSSPHDFMGRQTVRKKWKPFIQDPENRAVLLFFLGSSLNSNTSSLQQEIDREVSEYNDIVQEDFVDSYKNLTLKTAAILKWISSFCYNATFAIKSDSDVFIQPFRLVIGLRRQYLTRKTFIIGRTRLMGEPFRHPASKWYVPYHMYSEMFYPPFVLGPTYGFTVSAAPRLYEASQRLPFFYLEDVFITGLCSRFANIPVISDPDFTYFHKD